jgi:hypothetical protein
MDYMLKRWVAGATETSATSDSLSLSDRSAVLTEEDKSTNARSTVS